MIELHNLLLFLAASWLLILTPGPDMLYVLARSMAHGRATGLASALGVVCGILVHTLFAALGLSIVLRTSAVAFAVVKYMGAGYLVFLGVKSLIGRHGAHATATPKKRSLRATFLQGMATDVLNPKMALFFLAFLPQFVPHGSDAPGLQMLLLGAIYALCGGLFLIPVSLASGTLCARLGTRTRAGAVLRKFTGCVFIGLGIRLAFCDQRSL